MSLKNPENYSLACASILRVDARYFERVTREICEHYEPLLAGLSSKFKISFRFYETIKLKDNHIGFMKNINTLARRDFTILIFLLQFYVSQ